MDRLVALLLGLNLWAQLDLLPLVFEGGGALAAGMAVAAPLGLVWGLRRGAKGFVGLGLVPALLLAPLFLERGLSGERELGAGAAALLAVSWLAYLWAAGRATLAPALAPPRTSAADAVGEALPWLPGILVAILLVGLASLLSQATFAPGLAARVQAAFPDQQAEARVALLLGAFALWLGCALPAARLLPRLRAGAGARAAVALALLAGGFAPCSAALWFWGQGRVLSGSLAAFAGLGVAALAGAVGPRLPLAADLVQELGSERW